MYEQHKPNHTKSSTHPKPIQTNSIESSADSARKTTPDPDDCSSGGPPLTNRGVRIERDGGLEYENTEKTDTYAKCSFDWYQASIPALPEQIQGAFVEQFGGEFSECPPINGYEFGLTHSKMRFGIFWGKHHAHPNIKATSHHADRIAPWVRSRFPTHKVSRADIAFDFCFDGAFDYLTRKVAPIGKSAGVTSKFVGDPDENDSDYPDEMRTGRTWYFGSFKSDCMVTVYEKGLEMRSKGITNADINLCRLEVRIRPQKSRKVRAATLDPFEMVGFSKWISNAVGQILEEAPTVLPNYDKFEKPALAALTHMADQYSGVIKSFLDGDDQGGTSRTWHDLNVFLYGAMLSKEVRRQAAGHDPQDLVDRPKRSSDAD